MTTLDKTPTSKRCSYCKQEKPATSEYFYQKEAGKNGLSSQCRKCTAERQGLYDEANREKIYEQQRRYREANQEKVAERKRRYRQANPEKVAERHRRYREANREKIAEQRRQRRKATPEST